MDTREKKLAEIKKEIGKLPVGNITRKMIRGKSRMYLQWREDGKTKSRYVKASEEEEVLAAVKRREELKKEYRRIQLRLSEEVSETSYSFDTNVRTGADLYRVCMAVGRYRQRECMEILKKYLFSDTAGKVCLLYGLRRTGKTTMIFQAIEDLPKEKTAYIKIMGSNSMADLNRDLKILSENGFEYVFIDEVTLMRDFIDSASLLSDVYAMFGLKIVLSGTDSLGFAISAGEELYDRTVTIHTTYIPFREYAALLNIHDIDEYIRYGGTFRAGETDFGDAQFSDESISFRDDESTRRYIDTAVARNIQHSLACYQDGGHFMHLYDLYEKGELTGAVNRIIEDMNHRFLLSVLTADFKSHDLGSSAQIQRKQAAAKGKISVLDEIDSKTVTEKLMAVLEIKNRTDMAVELTQEHVKEIKEYLKILDLIVMCPTRTIGSGKAVESYLFVQPGMRYCQAQALVFFLMQDKVFQEYPAAERKQICGQILEEVRGRMLEEIVLLETMKTVPKNKKVFKLYFPIGEFDMVVADTENSSCEIYEIKHTDKMHEGQYKYLTDEEKCRQTEHEYGQITKKTVLYRGEDRNVGDIVYRNVVGYLERLRR